jgi:hypothetical protein
VKLLIALFTSLFATTAFSQSDPICGRPEQAAKLMKEYGEEIVFRGNRNLSPEGQTPVYTLVIITLNPVTDTWTLYEGYENGKICLIQSGIRGKSNAPKPRINS